MHPQIWKVEELQIAGVCVQDLPTTAVGHVGGLEHVVRMGRALYGHPDSVTCWDEYCSTEVNTVGFASVGTEWPSVFFHKELRFLLTIYVDDFKLAGRLETATQPPRDWT